MAVESYSRAASTLFVYGLLAAIGEGVWRLTYSEYGAALVPAVSGE